MTTEKEMTTDESIQALTEQVVALHSAVSALIEIKEKTRESVHEILPLVSENASRAANVYSVAEALRGVVDLVSIMAGKAPEAEVIEEADPSHLQAAPTDAAYIAADEAAKALAAVGLNASVSPKEDRPQPIPTAEA